jgi:hypothetical protein
MTLQLLFLRISSIAVCTLALVLPVAGCSSKPPASGQQQAQVDAQAYEAQIRKVVADPARAEQLIALTNQFQREMHESAVTVRNYHAKVAALDANYDATRQDYEVLFGQQEAHRETWIRRAGLFREQMAALTTDAEWEELKKARLRTLDADLQDLIP